MQGNVNNVDVVPFITTPGILEGLWLKFRALEGEGILISEKAP